MILAAGLSPAWQQILTFDSLQLGEVNRAQEAVWCASGKVINVAMAAHTLGRPVTMITSSGGLSGDVIEQEIAAVGLTAEWLRTDEATRVCTTLLPANGPTTELVENTADVPEELIFNFVNKTKIFANVAEVVVLSGSLPGNAPPETFAQIMRSIPTRFLLDFRGLALQFCLPIGPFLIKPNRTELETTFGTPLKTEQELIGAMRRMNDGGATWVVVSDGEEGVWVTSDEQAWHLQGPQVKTVNPIGCGDSLAGGIACELLNGDDVIRAVQFGMGAAANNAEQLLPARLDPERTQELADQIQIREISSRV